MQRVFDNIVKNRDANMNKSLTEKVWYKPKWEGLTGNGWEFHLIHYHLEEVTGLTVLSIVHYEMDTSFIHKVHHYFQRWNMQ